VGVQPDAIVADYLETVSLGAGFALTTNAARELVLIEDLLAEHGTTTEQAFGAALEGLPLADLLAPLTPETRQALTTWRGTLA
jgi:protein-tyrosine phosphatase